MNKRLFFACVHSWSSAIAGACSGGGMDGWVVSSKEGADGPAASNTELEVEPGCALSCEKVFL